MNNFEYLKELGHNPYKIYTGILGIGGEYIDFACDKCNIRVCTSFETKKLHLIETDNKNVFSNEIYNLTCSEQFIKNIIE